MSKIIIFPLTTLSTFIEREAIHRGFDGTYEDKFFSYILKRITGEEEHMVKSLITIQAKERTVPLRVGMDFNELVEILVHVLSQELMISFIPIEKIRQIDYLLARTILESIDICGGPISLDLISRGEDFNRRWGEFENLYVIDSLFLNIETFKEGVFASVLIDEDGEYIAHVYTWKFDSDPLVVGMIGIRSSVKQMLIRKCGKSFKRIGFELTNSIHKWALMQGAKYIFVEQPFEGMAKILQLYGFVEIDPETREEWLATQDKIMPFQPKVKSYYIDTSNPPPAYDFEVKNLNIIG